MANDFDDRLPARIEGMPGQYLTSQLRNSIGQAQNRQHAEGPCWNVLSQHFGETACRHNSALVQDVCVWRLPAIPGHPTLNLSIQSSTYGHIGGAAGATITFRTTPAADSIAIVHGAAVAHQWDDQSITFGEPAAGYGDLHLDLAALGQQVEVIGVDAAFAPLTSPLPTVPAALGGFEPWGVNAAAVARAAPASDGRRALNNGAVLLDYPRGLYCWSAIRGTSTGSGPTVMPAHPHRTVVLPTPRAIATDRLATVWLRVIADQVLDTRADIFAGSLETAETYFGRGWGPPIVSIDIPAINDPVEANRITWVDATLPITERRWLTEFPWLTVALGLRPGGLSTANVISASIWGGT